VLNGYEMASGSQRIHDSVLQDKIFELLGFSQEERVAKFGFFIEALRYGTPPHLGIAVGVDRLLMIMAGASSIREVIAFPKTQRAQDLMTRAPSTVSEEQMKELKIKVETVTKLESL
jgi:aspartyl-tRNA synthetase